MNITIVGSAGVCGIYEYSQTLAAGFCRLGHRARYLGVRNWDDRHLLASVRSIPAQDDLIVFEYEPGIFRLRALVLALAYLRFVKKKRIALSIHEIEPAKYPEYAAIQGRLGQPVRFGGLLEAARILWSTADVAARYASLRAFLFLLGRLPHRVIVHSARGLDNAGIAVNPRRQTVGLIPLLIKPQDGDRAALRSSLRLDPDRFYFIVPGFIFRRKQIVEVIRQLPEGSSLLVVGLPSEFDPGYLEEIHAFLKEHPNPNVHLVHAYDRMEQYLLAADAVVVYYKEGFQSAVAALAIGAGKPCIFSDLPAFDDYREAGIVVRTPQELHRAMVEVRNPECYERLRAGALRLREAYSPEKIAARYLELCR